ncbi:MAG: PEP-CTERM sorting domain-containing protein [Methylotenera sp.]|nr:PEP-CTERM sorting domain-containing protein [Methylotenera sp.]MDP3094369.1 PEP-CTERM sorting domain-containing protein [Methylotenera sp.]MDZ4222199.1 PEP-CTERM sorting domain-containing protein [Methylotenera sp.]
MSIPIAFAAFIFSSFAQAELVDLGVGAIYDSTRNITWLQDSLYQGVDLYPTGRIDSLYGTSVNNVDGSIHEVTSLDIYQKAIVGYGRISLGGNWWGATAWAKTLDFANTSGWRLPSEAEMLGVLKDVGFRGSFEPLSAGDLLYWTSSEFDFNKVSQIQLGYDYNRDPIIYHYLTNKNNDDNRFTQVAWAVHQGNIMAIPEPETFNLFLTGLGLIGFMVRCRRKSSPVIV